MYFLNYLAFIILTNSLSNIHGTQDINLANSNNINNNINNNDSNYVSKNRDGNNNEGDLARQQMEYRANEALDSIRDWTLRFGGEVYRGTQETTCHRAIKDQFDPSKGDPRRANYKASVVSIDWTRSHADIVRTISNSMGWHKSAVEAIVKASESLAGNHTYDEKLHFDYVDVHRLFDIDELIEDEQLPSLSSPTNETPPPIIGGGGGGSTNNADSGANIPVDEHHETAQLDSSGRIISDDLDQSQERSTASPDQPPAEPLGTPAPLIYQASSASGGASASGATSSGSTVQGDLESEWQTPVKYLKLSRHPNFGDIPISTEVSAVHVPVHIYPADPVVMNSIAWSEELTKVFKNNFVRNPKLTNQYFASPHGFMRLFPAQKWQIPRTDPDLYDARMRPWYSAGASSRKDIVILIDSSGSMTGNRRDIAKGVIFEILDTLTDNDHFLILKFSDTIQQVGVPSCSKMRVERNQTKIAPKNTMFKPQAKFDSMAPGKTNGDTTADSNGNSNNNNNSVNGTDIDSLYLLPATGRNVRYVKTNFTIATSGIANFSNALVTAFEVLKKYQDTETLGSQCNQAIMLITDGAPSDFEEIFNRYNYPNAPVRVFSYLIGREAGDPTQTKMMACNNRGFYTHVINLAEVRETVQQYIPVMARPLVLNRSHPTTWTPAYGELTYQMLTDWIWESRRRERARALLAGGGGGGGGVGGNSRHSSQGGATGYKLDIQITNDDNDLDGLTSNLADLSDQQTGGGGGDSSSASSSSSSSSSAYDDRELDALDIFGYNDNPDCFWETHRNDLLTTVVQPVYDQKNESRVVEKFLNKNSWVKKESLVRTANLLGIAAADMKINDIIALAPSHKLGSNGYAIMLTNNGLIMHHPDLRSVLEPFTSVPSEMHARILKPFFSSLDFVQVEHILDRRADSRFVAMRQEAVEGKTGWRELNTKRTLDCQRRVQSRKQIFYYKPLEQFPFSFIIAIPQPYGSHRIEAQIEIKNSSLPEKLTTYFTTSDYDIWSVHPDYQYCDGASNNTIVTLLDMLQRLEENKLDDIQWKPAESTKPPLFSPDKIICDKSLVQSLVYDAVATYSFSDNCGPPSLSAESSLVSMFGVRFSFVSTRSGLTRVRHYNVDDIIMKKEALAFAKKHARASDETYYSRTVDYNMLINDTATLIQVPFNTHKKIAERFNRFEQQEAAAAAAANYNGDSAAAAAASGGSGQSNGGMFDQLSSSSSSSSDSELVDELSARGGGGGGGGTNDNGKLSLTRLSVREMNLFEKLDLLTNSSLHVIATQSIIANEGAQRAVAGVVGVFYDYAAFVLRFLNTTNTQYTDLQSAKTQFKKPAHCYLNNDNNNNDASSSAQCNQEPRGIKCGYSNDTIDCLLIDNNGYIIVSEHLSFIGRHLNAYDATIMSRLVAANVFYEINITDYQSICMRQEEKSGGGSSSGCAARASTSAALIGSILNNMLVTLTHLWAVIITIGATLVEMAQAAAAASTDAAQGRQAAVAGPGATTAGQQQQQQQQTLQPMMALLPNKTYLRPCNRVLTRYETRPGPIVSPEAPEYYTTRCKCSAWFVYEQVPKTNLIMLIVDVAPACRKFKCHNDDRDSSNNGGLEPVVGSSNSMHEQDDNGGGGDVDDDDELRESMDDSLNTEYNIVGSNEEQACQMFERESKLYKKKLDACFSHHPEEEHTKLCGAASQSGAIGQLELIVLILALLTNVILRLKFSEAHQH